MGLFSHLQIGDDNHYVAHFRVYVKIQGDDGCESTLQNVKCGVYVCMCVHTHTINSSILNPGKLDLTYILDIYKLSHNQHPELDKVLPKKLVALFFWTLFFLLI